MRKPLNELAVHHPLSAATSSARSRLDLCLKVTGLAPLFAPDRRFSAEYSLPEPTSKSEPAVYAFAGQQTGVSPDEGLVVEDTLNGVLSAVAAGYRTREGTITDSGIHRSSSDGQRRLGSTTTTRTASGTPSPTPGWPRGTARPT